MQLFLRLGHPLNQVKIKECRAKYYENEFWCAPAVENDAEDKDYKILVFLVDKVIGK